MTVLVIDYGMGNLASARRSLEECGAKVEVSADVAAVGRASRIVIPGVGSFKKAMERLVERGWTDALRRAAREERIPTLGICLGMQLLATRGSEGGETQGLDLIPGAIEILKPSVPNERVPHVGWNEAHVVQPHPLFAGIPDRSDFYFVHSFHFAADWANDVIATTDACGGFISGVASGNIAGVQFHPEKSSRAGFRLLKNFLAWVC